MSLNLKRLLARGPEAIEAEKQLLREIPAEEAGLTLLYILIGGVYCVFADDVFDWLLGAPLNTPTLQTIKGFNFVFTTALVLYLVLRRTFRSRRQAQEALRLSQQRFEFVALATTDAIWDLNLETKVIWWSEGLQKLFGYRPEDISSEFGWWLDRLHPDDRDRVLQAVERSAGDAGNSWAGQYRFRRQDGSYAYVLDRGCIIFDAAGKPARIVGGISDISERRHAEQALENSRAQLRALTARLQSGREEERSTVAREIHDELGQLLTAVKINLDWLEKKLGERSSDPSLNPWLDRVVESEEMVDTAITSVQRIATDLRPASLDNLGLGEALQQEARRFQQRNGINCELQLPLDPLNPPPASATALFRVFQEALTNVARHAEAKAVRVVVTQAADHVQLQVEDNGRGIPPEAVAASRSLGLLGMRERALTLGGEVTIEPIAPRGTRVTLRLPVSANGQQSKSSS